MMHFHIKFWSNSYQQSKFADAITINYCQDNKWMKIKITNKNNKWMKYEQKTNDKRECVLKTANNPKNLLLIDY